VTDAGTFGAVSFASDKADQVLAARSALFDCMEACTQKYIKKENKKKSKKKDDKSKSSGKRKKSKKKKEISQCKEEDELDDLSIYSGVASVMSDMSCIV
jgi:hypothetical protein